MPANLIKKDVITALAARAAGLENTDGNPRLKQVVNRLLVDLMAAIDDLDISMDEFWAGVAYIGQAGKQNELGLIVPGVVLEHFLDSAPRRGRAPRRARRRHRPHHRGAALHRRRAAVEGRGAARRRHRRRARCCSWKARSAT